MRTVTVFVLACLSAVPAALAEGHAAGRQWPSQQSGTVDRGDDPPMGAGGHCRHEGERIDQGTSLCLDVRGERYMALCGRVLNNTSWLREADGC